MDEYGIDKLIIRKLVLDERPVTMVDQGISCGTGSDVGYPFQERLNIWELFLKKDDDAFIVQTFGDSMVEAGIENGDRVVFVKQPTYQSGDIVLAFVNGDARIKYYHEKDGVVWLVPANAKYKPCRIEPTDDFYINGALVQIMKDVKRPTMKIAKLVQDEEKKLPFMKLKKELPPELDSNRARAQLKVLMENQLLDDSWQPVAKVPVWKLGGIADKLSEVLGIDDKWKFFGMLWNIDKNNLKNRWADAKDLEKEKEFTKKILNRIY